MNPVFIDPRVDLLHPAFFSRNREDALRTADPVVADGFVWLVKLWWKQWTKRRSQPGALVQFIRDQAAQRQLHRLSVGL